MNRTRSTPPSGGTQQAAPTADGEILTPSALNRMVRGLLSDALPLVWVEGEISNLARPASGHVYFTLKDERAQIRCALFKQHGRKLTFRPADGDKVLVRARVGLYEARGEYQLIAEHMEEAGEGALRRQFEELKARLEAEGLFADSLKRTLPVWPRRIGAITSASGAAIRDVLNVLRRRLPLAEVDVLPVPVQGDTAPDRVVAMLQGANAAGRYDVLLVTRGGGSLEDLAAFNDENVARAIRASAIPVMSAVGHEVDFTIADFVADKRAPTPSAAAELLVPDSGEVQQQLQNRERRLTRHMQQQTQGLDQRVDHLEARLRASGPVSQLTRRRERLNATQQRLRQRAQYDMERRHDRLRALHGRLRAQHPQAALTRQRRRLEELAQRLQTGIQQHTRQQRQRLEHDVRALRAVSPLDTLKRGYTILRDDDGNVIRSAATVPRGHRMTATLADGSMQLQRTDEPAPSSASRDDDD